MEVRLRNHCCHRKAITMTCCKCVSHSCIFLAVCLLTTWTDTYLTVSCPLLKLPSHWNTVLLVQLGAASPHTDASQWWMSAAFLPQAPPGPSLSMIVTFHCPWQCTIDRRNHPTKKEPTPSSATIYCVNVQIPLPRNTRSFFMARYLCSHVTMPSVKHLWMALVCRFSCERPVILVRF
jgi:hypothetical protein